MKENIEEEQEEQEEEQDDDLKKNINQKKSVNKIKLDLHDPKENKDDYRIITNNLMKAEAANMTKFFDEYIYTKNIYWNNDDDIKLQHVDIKHDDIEHLTCIIEIISRIPSNISDNGYKDIVIGSYNLALNKLQPLHQYYWNFSVPLLNHNHSILYQDLSLNQQYIQRNKDIELKISSMLNLSLKHEAKLSFLRANPQLSTVHITIANINNVVPYFHELCFIAYITDDYNKYKQRFILARGTWPPYPIQYINQYNSDDLNGLSIYDDDVAVTTDDSRKSDRNTNPKNNMIFNSIDSRCCISSFYHKSQFNYLLCNLEILISNEIYENKNSTLVIEIYTRDNVLKLGQLQQAKPIGAAGSSLPLPYNNQQKKY